MIAPLLIAIIYLKNIFPKVSNEIKRTISVINEIDYHKIVIIIG